MFFAALRTRAFGSMCSTKKERGFSRLDHFGDLMPIRILWKDFGELHEQLIWMRMLKHDKTAMLAKGGVLYINI